MRPRQKSTMFSDASSICRVATTVVYCVYEIFSKLHSSCNSGSSYHEPLPWDKRKSSSIIVGGRSSEKWFASTAVPLPLQDQGKSFIMIWLDVHPCSATDSSKRLSSHCKKSSDSLGAPSSACALLEAHMAQLRTNKPWNYSRPLER